MMGLFDAKLFAWLQPRPPVRAWRSRALNGRRVRRLTEDEYGETWGFNAVIAPDDHESNWRTLNLDSKTLSLMAPEDLLEMLPDLSPEISAGIWNFLRLCNPGWEAKAYRPGSDDIDQRGQAVLDEFLSELPYVYEGDQTVPADTVINALFIGGWLRGGFFAELVLDENGRMPLNIATPDPASIRFRKIEAESYGQVYQLGQYQNGVFVPLSLPTVRYVPIDPLPGKPYGRALVSPGLFSALFLLSILHDVKRVIMQQGWPRIDISVNFEALAQNAPPTARPGSEEFDTWVAAVMDEVTDVYEDLEPDDAYVHSDVISVNRPVGTVDGSSLSAIDSVITALERMAARSLKMQPLLLGINDSTTETNAIRQWEIQSATVKSMQHLMESLLERLLTIALRVQGIQAQVEFRFAELRDSEMLRDAQTEALRIRNAQQKYAAGWISQDQASEEITGTPADVEFPRVLDLGGTADLVADDLAGGLEETAVSPARLLAEVQAARLAVEAAYPSPNGVHGD